MKAPNKIPGTLAPHVLGLILLAAAVAAPAWSQTVAYPTKPVRIVVPLPPGTELDTQVRLFSTKLSPLWGQPVLAENKPGGGLIIGTDAVAKAAPDGHTLLATISNIVQAP